MKRDGEEKVASFIRTTLAYAATALMLLGAQPATAASTGTRVLITARVLAHAHISVLQQPASFVVTKKDISRGYVETSSPVITEVRSNDSRGCLIILESDGAPVREIVVGVMGKSIISDPSGGMFVLPVQGRQLVAFTFRFMLASDAQPGNYAWPVRMQAQTL